MKAIPILHPGKTERDHQSGAWAKRYANQKVRSDYYAEGTAKGTKGRRVFPIETCDGRESRALKRVHKCGQRATPGKKGGGPCKHRKGKKA